MQQTYLIPQGVESKQDGLLIAHIFLTKPVVKTGFIEAAGSYRIAAACYCQNRTFLYLEPGKSDVFQRFLSTCNKFWFRIMCSKAKKEMHEQFQLCTLSNCLSFLIRFARICRLHSCCLVFWLAEDFRISANGISWAQLPVWFFCTFLGDTLNWVLWSCLSRWMWPTPGDCTPNSLALSIFLTISNQFPILSKNKGLFWLQNLK